MSTHAALHAILAKRGFVPFVNDCDAVFQIGDRRVPAEIAIHPDGHTLALSSQGKPVGMWAEVEIAQAQLDAQGLPGSNEALRRTWLCLSEAPGIEYWGEWFELDRAVMGELRATFIALQSVGYEPPIVQAHVDEGPRWGDILDLRPWLDPEDGVLKLCALIQWTKTAWAGIQAKEYRYISPHYGEVRDGRGKIYPLGLREVTLTSQPYQKAIGDIQSWARRGGIKMSRNLSILSGGGVVAPKLNDADPKDTSPPVEPPKGEGDTGADNTGEGATLAKVVDLLERQGKELAALKAKVEGKPADKPEGDDKDETDPKKGEDGKPTKIAASDDPVVQQLIAQNQALVKRLDAQEAKLSEVGNRDKRSALLGKVVILSEENLKTIEGKVGIDVLAGLATEAPKAPAAPAPEKSLATDLFGRRFSSTPSEKPKLRSPEQLAKMSDDALFFHAEEIALSEKRDLSTVFAELQVKAGRMDPKGLPLG